MTWLLQNPGRALLLNSPPVFVGGKRNAGYISHCLQGSGNRRRHGEGLEGLRRHLGRPDGRVEQLKLDSSLGLGLEGNFQQVHYVSGGLISPNFSTLPTVYEQNRCGRKIGCWLGKSSSPSSSQQRRIHKQGRLCARGDHRGIHSRKVKVGLIYKLVRFGGGGGVDGNGGGDDGHNWGAGGGGGGGGGDGGDGGDGADFLNSNEGSFNFFSGLLSLLLERCKSGMLTWAVLASLAGFLVSSLDWRDCAAHAKPLSIPGVLVDGEKGVSPLEKGKEREKKGFAEGAIWEVKGSKWKRFVVDLERDEFIFDVVKPSEEEAEGYDHSSQKKKGSELHKRIWVSNWLRRGKDLKTTLQDAGVWTGELVRQIFLPAGFPGSVTEGYIEFTSWRLGQIIASQVSGVLTTQALLYAVGLGKGAIPTAAAVNWVLRDGIGYLSKIMLSKYGRHFDVHPKGWRLVSDIIENASYGLELLTPLVPHLFVYLGAAAGAGRSAAGLIQVYSVYEEAPQCWMFFWPPIGNIASSMDPAAATKSCFNANFAAQRNFAEIIAKGEAQGMASKSVGIGLGILISGYVGSQGPLLVVTFGVTSALHIFFNLKSYQAVHLRTLNPYRASLVLAEYLKSGNVPSIKDVNAEEPIFFGVPWFNPKPRRDQGKLDTVSPDSKRVASAFEKNVELGVSLATVVHTKGEADALMHLYSKDKFLLAVQGNHIKVVLKEGAAPRDMLRAMVQAVYFLNISNEGRIHTTDLVTDCNIGGILQVTHDHMEKNFESITHALSGCGWVSDGVLARAAPNRLVLENQTLQPLVGVTA